MKSVAGEVSLKVYFNKIQLISGTQKKILKFSSLALVI